MMSDSEAEYAESVVSQQFNNASFIEKLVSASFGALLTSLVTTPLDVVKTRMQAVNPAPKLELSPSAVSCIYYPICKEADASFLRTACAHAVPHSTLHRPENMIHVMTNVARTEGLKILWSGLSASLVMAVPSTTLYFTAYDEFKLYLETGSSSPLLRAYAPLIAGISGRVLTSSVVAPLELLRTKLMYQQTRKSLSQFLTYQIRSEGFASLWRGLGPTLWRDVPFSGLYWLSYERTKSSILNYLHLTTGTAEASFGRTFSVAFASGVLAGALAAVVTTPFDVVKTRRQVQMHREFECHTTVPHRTGELLRFIWREEGFRGLFAGVVPRVAKVAPACAIMISSYELGKHLFAKLE